MNYGQAGLHTFKLGDFDTIFSVNLTDFLKVGGMSVGSFVRRHNKVVEKKGGRRLLVDQKQRVDRPAAASPGAVIPLPCRCSNFFQSLTSLLFI